MVQKSWTCQKSLDRLLTQGLGRVHANKLHVLLPVGEFAHVLQNKYFLTHGPPSKVIDDCDRPLLYLTVLRTGALWIVSSRARVARRRFSRVDRRGVGFSRRAGTEVPST